MTKKINYAILLIALYGSDNELQYGHNQPYKYLPHNACGMRFP